MSYTVPRSTRSKLLPAANPGTPVGRFNLSEATHGLAIRIDQNRTISGLRSPDGAAFLIRNGDQVQMFALSREACAALAVLIANLQSWPEYQNGQLATVDCSAETEQHLRERAEAVVPVKQTAKKPAKKATKKKTSRRK